MALCADAPAPQKFQYLADKYAPSTPDIAETLARLQLPPHTSVDDTSPVPLPRRSSPQSQHHLALVIRDGRRAASQLVALTEPSKTTGSSRESLSHTSHHQTFMSTALEEDFTVEGKKGNLQCPFSRQAAADDDAHASQPQVAAPSLNQSVDPICAAMYDESASQPPPSATAASKCPIRFMDKHSAEEIAHYVEAHKHQLPRSHEVCLRRYQKNEEQIKKLDSKHGNIVSMIEGLGQIHQSMLPHEQEPLRHPRDVDRASNERVESWAQAVSATPESDAGQEPAPDGGERQAHFDRPMKEVRVGESPSRPWGISVPIYDVSGPEQRHPPSPPPAPVRMPSPAGGPQALAEGGGCPFDHTKLAARNGLAPARNGQAKADHAPKAPRDDSLDPMHAATPPSPRHAPRPVLVDPSSSKTDQGAAPHMVFTGPVFIGYPMEQAIQFLNQHRQV